MTQPAEVGSDRLPEAPAARGARARKPLGWLTGAIVLAAVVLVVTHRAEERELLRLFREARLRWLLAALVLQALTYVCAAAVWQRALARRGAGARLAPLVPLGLAKLFTDQAVPSIGMSGTLLVLRGLLRRGFQRADVVSAVLTGLVAFQIAYLLATIAAITILWRHAELRLVILLPGAAVCLLAAGFPLAIVILHRQATRRPPRQLERWPGVRDVAEVLRGAPLGRIFAPRLLLETTVLQVAIFLLDALTLDAALRAVSHTAGASLVFASFVMASVVSTLAWVPGGLGTFEATCVGLLHLHGVPIETAFAATLLLRGFTFWLPMLPGFALARREAAPLAPSVEPA